MQEQKNRFKTSGSFVIMKAMLRLIKKYFIPHEGNGHKPHILRWEAALIILSAVLLVEVYFLLAVFWFIPQNNFFASIVPSDIVGFTNQDRLAGNLGVLKTNPLLERAAQLKAQDMAAKSYFAHTSPEGLTPWHWVEEVDYKYLLVGENLAVNFSDSQDANDAWMNSPTHRANILNNNFVETGVGAAKGRYEGRETTFIVQFFGRPAAPVAALAETKPAMRSTPAIPAAAGISVPPKSEPAASSRPAIENSPEVAGEVKGAPETVESNPSELAVKADPASPGAPSVASRLLSTPRAVSNYIFFTLLTIVALALLLKIFIKIKIQHPALIINGVALILIISTIILANQYLVLSQAKII